ncbi:hypothetical protein AGABI2DRAFT_134645 [Agaricus bisporus var. bisporus H97]|uniref:hypothetical protein n=1 Tax=Agaricus bisporus var. bisporus (strain H97 / ATCC MYA-4626 / FGSC 10389) TaxID=936046 RepID=UPI00029F6FB8|nr:hypothetical protein AGABI2DRAFT_134645 [Agaricus bisporus var. bisporus H97]EKV49036.1 hypothetical protein AGABI2DRAFT_134645 [Agaricus bisporus var. bisporus H97]
MASGMMYRLPLDMDSTPWSWLYGMVGSVNKVEFGNWMWEISSDILEFHWDLLSHEILYQLQHFRNVRKKSQYVCWIEHDVGYRIQSK